jgi:phytoene synthase
VGFLEVAFFERGSRTEHGDLAAAYERCRRIHAQRGRSYYLATALLPAKRRRAVHALYAFTRLADDIVDDGLPPDQAAAALAQWHDSLLRTVDGAPSTDPVLPAVADTVRTYGLDLADLDVFIRSMAMDLSVSRYRTYDDLLAYMEGSSAVIGTLMLPILGHSPGAPGDPAWHAARELGYAFQLTNFIRDVAEDLARGRIYLPMDDLARFGVTSDTLSADAARGRSSGPVRELVQFECGRAQAHYAAALPGIALLSPRARLCIRAAFLLYGAIIDEIAHCGYDVLAGRAVVSRPRRASLVVAAVHPVPFAAQAHRRGIT